MVNTLITTILLLAPATGVIPATRIARELEASPRPFTSVYILMQESTFREGIQGPTGDHGIGQVTGITREAAKCLPRDTELDCHTKVLKMKLTLCSGKWECYHSTRQQLQTVYRKQVIRHRNKVQKSNCFLTDYPL